MASVTKGKDENRADGAARDDADLEPSSKGATSYKSDKADKLSKVEQPDKADRDEAAEGKTLEYARPGTRAAGASYFTIYKKGQGYWTRMGTALGATLLGLALAYTLYDKVPSFFVADQAAYRRLGLGIAVGFLVVFAVVAWRLMNKPANVDFLIATDSEMKKVNWTSRKELIGSTKVVVGFMFLVAIFLFAVDQIFAWLMYAIDVLKVKPGGF